MAIVAAAEDSAARAVADAEAAEAREEAAAEAAEAAAAAAAAKRAVDEEYAYRKQHGLLVEDDAEPQVRLHK